MNKTQAMLKAQAEGLSTFQWEPCKKCGCTEMRAYSNGKCVECDRARVREYRRKNPEKCKQMIDNWRERNKEYLANKRQSILEGMPFREKLNEIAGEYGLTLLDVVVAWGNRASVTSIYNQSETKFRIICAGVKELSK